MKCENIQELLNLNYPTLIFKKIFFTSSKIDEQLDKYYYSISIQMLSLEKYFHVHLLK